MAKKVKIYEIAKGLGITSAELVEVCQRAGRTDVKHHSQAVSPEEADEIRKTAIKLYKPKQEQVVLPVREKPKPEAAPPRPSPPPVRQAPVMREAPPAPPPIPKGGQLERPRPAPQAFYDEEEEEEALPRLPLRSRPRPERIVKRDEQVTTRTIVFKQPKKVVEKRREEKIEMLRPVTVRDLSERLGIPAAEIIKELMFDHGIRANINETLDDEVVQLIGLAHEVEITLKEPKSAEEELLESLAEDKPEDLVPRPPVVTLLGHVDHGKTSILDRIRNARVAESEAGGITQDIGAWQTQVRGRTITFIDTPGHEAFTEMRARGARVTDIVVLVVAADDGVMPQTIEAISHARAAEVPIVVAINKVDKPQADPRRVRQQLAQHGLNPEEWGGDVACIDVSAVTGQGIDALLERLVLEAELLDVRANPNRPARGVVLEARMVPGRGVVTDLIVQNGTLRRGDILVCGSAYGTVRALFNDRGEQIDQVLPSQPAAMSGLSRVPEAGQAFLVVPDMETARRIAEERQRMVEHKRLQPRRRVTLENLYESIQRGETKQLNIVLKADVQGSIDPIIKSLNEISTAEASVRIIHSGIGRVNRSDVLLADASDAIILAFRVGADEAIREMASERGVQIVEYNVIYDVTEQIRSALEGLLEPEKKEERLGTAEVRRLFHISRIGTIAGCYVTQGIMRRGARVRVVRDGQIVHDGTMASMKQEKNDVREVEAGHECGIHIAGFDDIQLGDQIQCYEVVAVRRTLSARPGREAASPEARKT